MIVQLSYLDVTYPLSQQVSKLINSTAHVPRDVDLSKVPQKAGLLPRQYRSVQVTWHRVHTHVQIAFCDGRSQADGF
jgi:hypothetical protein